MFSHIKKIDNQIIKVKESLKLLNDTRELYTKHMEMNKINSEKDDLILIPFQYLPPLEISHDQLLLGDS